MERAPPSRDRRTPEALAVCAGLFWRAAEEAFEAPAHVALVAKPGFEGDFDTGLVGFPQEQRRLFDTEASGELKNAFAGDASKRIAEPGRVQADFFRKRRYTQRRIGSHAPPHRLEPRTHPACGAGCGCDKSCDGPAKIRFRDGL